MIAADTSTWLVFLEGGEGRDVGLLVRALREELLLVPPVVLTEILSGPKLGADAARVVLRLPMIELHHGYWERAGLLRARVLSRGRKARLGDALIAQSCIDRGIPLITRDRDFRAFADAAGLDLAIG